MHIGSNYLQSKSIEDIIKEITDFESLDLKELSIEQIKSKIHNIILGHLRITYKINPEGLTRGRKNLNNEIYYNKEDLWYPNWDEISKDKWKLNRCSDLGEKMFYASSETDTVICELQLEKDDYFTVGDFFTKARELNAIVQVIGIIELAKFQEKFRVLFNDYYDILKKDSPEDYEKNILIDKFLSNQFQIIVNENESWKYKLTIAISKILLSNPETDGLLYPSISSNSKGANLALKTTIVDENFVIGKAGIYQVVDKTKNEGISVRLIQVPAQTIAEELIKIKWRLPTALEFQEFSVKCD
jgi:hypothetical protein